ncbi:MAG: hypothetical protein ACRDWE_08815 [Acidimicrobiales bacterium]
MTAAWRALAIAGGILLLLGTLGSVFTTLVVPRATSARLVRAVSAFYGKLSRPALRLWRTYESKDRLLALVGPLGIVTVFVTWLCLLVVGFGLVTWGVVGGSVPYALEVAGSSVFTLGVLSIARGGPEAIEFVTAGVGLLVIALEIAYLPALYNAFSAREAEVTLLSTRAGVPAWGPELLARAQRFSLVDDLPLLYREWERWAAAVAESHANYPSLMWLRSPQPLRSWLTALAAVLDAAALENAVAPARAPLEGRLCLQVGFNCLRLLADALHIAYDPDPLPTAPMRLSYEEYLEGIARLESAGFDLERSPEDAWRHFRGWRVNYEPIVDALTAVIVPPPAPWFVARPWLGEPVLPQVRNRTPDDPHATRPRG